MSSGVEVSDNQASASSLTRDASWLAISNVFYAVGQWCLIVVIARANGPAAAGMYVLGSAIAGPIVGLSQLGLRQVMISDVRGEFSYLTYSFLRSLLSAAAVVIVGIIAIAFSTEVETLLTLLMVGAARCGESVLDIYYGRLQKSGNYRGLGWTMMSASALTLTLAVLGLFLTKSVAGAAAGFLIAICAINAVVLFQRTAAIADRSPTGWPIHDSLVLAKRALPLGVSSALVLLNSNLPRYALAWAFGTAAVGQYVLVEQFVTAGALVINSVLQAASPELARRFSFADREQFRSLMFRLLAFAAAAGLCGVLGSLVAGRSLVELVYGEGHDAAIAAFPVVAVAGTTIFLASAVGFAITATGKFAQMPMIYIVVVGATTLSLWSLVPTFGLQGAAFGHATGYLVAIALGIILVLRR